MATPQTLPPTVGPYRIPIKSSMTRQYYQRRNDSFAPPISESLSESFSITGVPTSPVSSPPRRMVKRIYSSPRCTVEDAQLFPTDHSLYKTDKRWESISKQAGPHRQDGTVLRISRRLAPQALKNGMTKQGASRVRSLHLWLDHNEDILPEWLDIISSFFTNLECLTLSEDSFPGEEEMAVSARMRRLYVLYRVPYLKSIDEMPVTRAERKLARPDDPNGERVNREEWMGNESLLDGDDEEEEKDNGESAKDDDEGELPLIPANESTGNHTAKEMGVELNQELAEKVAEMHQSDADRLEDDLAGESLLEDILQMSSSGSGEQREDTSSNDFSVGDRDTVVRSKSPKESSPRGDAVEVDLSGAVRSIMLKKKPDQSMTQRQIPRIQVDVQNQDPLSPSPNQINDLDDNLDLVSVVSSTQEWTAACGVLAFRSDRACAPRLRLAFCGRNKKNLIDEDDMMSIRNKAKKALREKHEKQIIPCTSVQRQSSMQTPNGCDPWVCNAQVQFFPESDDTEDQSANKKCPPSKSLSSPFPMQFRERTTPLHISTEETNTEETNTEEQQVPDSPRGPGPMETITQPLPKIPMPMFPKKSNQSSKAVIKAGDLPPPCPGGSRRKLVITTVMSPLRSKKTRRLMRQRKASKKARSTSVLDDMEEEDDDSEDEEEFEEEEDVKDTVTSDNIENSENANER